VTSFGGRLGGRFAGALLGRGSRPTLQRYLFDSGFGLPLRTVVANGILSLLARLDGANGGYLAALEATTVQIRGSQDEETMSILADQLGGRTPAVLVNVGDRDFEPAGDVKSWKGDLTIQVYVLVNSMQTRESRLTGDAESAANPIADPGAYVILEHVLQLLAGQIPGTGGTKTKELRPKTERQLWIGDDLDIWEQVYTVQLSNIAPLRRDIGLELKAIETYSRLASQAASDPPIVETTTEISA